MNKALVAFFCFGATMCTLTILLLAFPGTPLDAAGKVNPEGHAAFQKIGAAAFVLMAIVGTACAATAFGLAYHREWGRKLAIMVLTVNLIGDVTGAVVRHDPRTLIGLPIGGALIYYLVKHKY